MKDINNQVIEATLEVGKEATLEIIKPTAKSIGDNIGLFVDGIMGWIGFWGKKQQIKREEYLNDYKKKISKKLKEIPEDNLVEPSIKIIGPAIEASKYYIDDDFCREMFAKLIAATCDSRVNECTHPSFIEIIKELSVLDAKFLLIFIENNTYPMVELEEHHIDGKLTPYLFSIVDFKGVKNEFQVIEQVRLSKVLDNLLRLGIIKKNSAVLELNYDYNLLKKHPIYNMCEKTIEKDSKLIMKKYRIELTKFGKDFVKCCIPQDN